MPTPLEKIKNGIIAKDWEQVIDGYQILSGDDLSVTIVKEKQAPLEKKKKGRPKKNKDVPVVTQPVVIKKRRPPNSTALTGTVSHTKSDGDKTEAVTQQVVRGKIPQFFSE